MNRKAVALTIAAAFVALLAVPAWAAEQAPDPKSLTKIETLTATITAIDAAKRLVTLKGPEGKSETIQVPETVTRFSELKVGDQVTFKYTQSIVVRLQKPGDAMVGNVAAGIEKGGGPKPGGKAAAEATVVVTLVALDPKVPSVTIKNDAGEVRTIKIRDEKNLEGFKAGDKVAITYVESLAIDVTTPAKK
jgi:Cu/Ag efflux protein CusF